MRYEIKKEFLAMVKKAYSEALFAGTSGNLSIYDREEDSILITPSSLPYETMTEEDLMLIDLEGRIKEGKHKPSSEWRMHAEIYREKPEVNAVVHTHSPFATSFGVIREEIPVILIEMVPFLGGNVRVAGFAVPGTNAVGKNCVEALKDRYVCTMANHGVVAVGKDPEQAYIRAVYAEDAAKIYTYAKINGQPVVLEQTYIDRMRG